MKQHTEPCIECPFRRTSLNGYLGASKVDDFAEIAMLEERMPCHMTVDYERPDWRVRQQTAPQCAGRAIMWTNTCKLPRDRSLLRIDRKDDRVFANILEFREHHNI